MILREKYKFARIVVAIVYLIGLLGFIFPVTHELFQKLTPVNLLFSLFVILLFHENWNLKFIILSIFIALAGYFVEVVGVNTGIIFGEYIYGKTLGIKVLETPLMIGVNWFILTYATFLIFKNINLSIYIKAALSSFLMLIYDFFLEPIAIKFDMWSWEHITVPVKNYLAWFIIAYILILMFYVFRVKVKNKLSSTVFIAQLLFFILLNIIF
jgi:uncharacterized membrane protein